MVAQVRPGDNLVARHSLIALHTGQETCCSAKCKGLVRVLIMNVSVHAVYHMQLMFLPIDMTVVWILIQCRSYMATTNTLLYTNHLLSTTPSLFLRRLLTDEEAGETSSGLLPLLVEHTEETILSARLATVVPFFSVPDDLMHAVRLESEK